MPDPDSSIAVSKRKSSNSRRKVVAALAIVGAVAVLWLERSSIAYLNFEGVFWLLVAALTITLAGIELADRSYRQIGKN